MGGVIADAHIFLLEVQQSMVKHQYSIIAKAALN